MILLGIVSTQGSPPIEEVTKIAMVRCFEKTQNPSNNLLLILICTTHLEFLLRCAGWIFRARKTDLASDLPSLLPALVICLSDHYPRTGKRGSFRQDDARA